MSEMENPTPQADNTNEAAPPAKKARPGNSLALAALVVALLVGTVAVVLWSDVRQMRRESEGAEAQLRSSVTALENREQEQRSSLSTESRERDDQLTARQDSLEQGMQGLREQLARDRTDWLVAEADYLMRIASRRLQLERDVHGALIALQGADSLLAEGNNPLYLPVREKLHDELAALEAVAKVDTDGIALELSSISRKLDTLPLATARRAINKYQEGPQEGSDAEASWFSRLMHGMWNDLKSLVTVRRLDQKIQPLLPPEERYFLVQNLRLRLESAHIALLRGDDVLYQESLRMSSQWLDEYFDSDDAAVQGHLRALQKLSQVNVAPQLPEIGAAELALDKLRSKNSRGKRP